MKHYYGVKYNNEITEYSPFFDTEEQRNNWYENFGVKLERMFNRRLLAVIKK